MSATIQNVQGLEASEKYGRQEVDSHTLSFLLANLTKKEKARLLRKAAQATRHFQRADVSGHVVWYPHYLQVEANLIKRNSV